MRYKFENVYRLDKNYNEDEKAGIEKKCIKLNYFDRFPIYMICLLIVEMMGYLLYVDGNFAMYKLNMGWDGIRVTFHFYPLFGLHSSFFLVIHIILHLLPTF